MYVHVFLLLLLTLSPPRLLVVTRLRVTVSFSLVVWVGGLAGVVVIGGGAFALSVSCFWISNLFTAPSDRGKACRTPYYETRLFGLYPHEPGRESVQFKL